MEHTNGVSHKRKVFGFTDYPDQEEQYFYLINLLILLTKFHIHKCKFTNKKPNFMFCWLKYVFILIVSETLWIRKL